MSTTPEDTDHDGIIDRLTRIERRLSAIEARLDLQDGSRETELTAPDSPAETSLHSDEDLENQIGENWFPKVGIIVLAIGVAFLLTFPYQGLPPVLPGLFGYVLAMGALALSRYWRNSYSQLARYVLGGGLVLLYFTTLRLYFFSTSHAIEDKRIELVLLLAVVCVSGLISLRARSLFMTGVTLTTGFITALIGADPEFVIPVSAALCTGAAIVGRARRSPSLLLFAIVLTYLSHVVWVLNNPVAGNAVSLVAFSPWNTLPLLLYAAIFGAGTLFRIHPPGEEGIVITCSFVNGLAAYALYLFLTVVRSGDALAAYQAAAAAVFLALAFAFWKKEASRYSTFVYAMLGYMAMSVSMIAYVDRPGYFVWLAWQSLVVVSTAVWFRSQYMVIANFAIYLLLFAAYVVSAQVGNVVSLSFGVVALASARVLNWQKERLALKTEMMRNAYLACAFLIFPFALYHALPGGYVSISWIVVALFYYVMSILLKSRKYRWMALLTLFLTIGHVLIIDSVNLEPIYRIISFLVLGTVLFWISVKYAKKRMRGTPPPEPGGMHT